MASSRTLKSSIGTTAATGSPLRVMTVGLPFCARVITPAKWARASRTFISLSSSFMVSVYADLCTRAPARHQLRHRRAGGFGDHVEDAGVQAEPRRMRVA